MIEMKTRTMVTACAPWEPNDQDYVEQHEYLVSLLSSWRDIHESNSEEEDCYEDLFEIVDGFFVNSEASRKLIDMWKTYVRSETKSKTLRRGDDVLFMPDLIKNSNSSSNSNSATSKSGVGETTKAPISVAATATPTETPKSRSPKRERRRKKKDPKSKSKGSNHNHNHNNNNEHLHEVVDQIHETSALNLDALDDLSSAWEDAQKEGRVWGGRGFGGRGVNRGLGTYRGKDAVVNGLTLAFDGKELLRETHLAIAHGHRYGLWGKNGVGKSTLLRRIASGRIPGWPLHLGVKMVQQEILGSDKTVRECMSNAHADAGKSRSSSSNSKKGLEEELAGLETQLNELTLAENDILADNDALEELTLRMSELYEELEDIERKEDSAIESENSHGNSNCNRDLLEDDTNAFRGLDDSSIAILRGLSFETSMLDIPIRELSGGWRMKVALAEALCCHPDILLLDEPTNHLDAAATIFLEDYILKHKLTIVVVSHCGDFLDAICTDMIKFENQTLEYHVGNYSTFRDREEQLRRTNTHISEAVVRKEKKAMEFIQKQKSMANHKRRDDNKQRQAKEREKKLGRIGLYNSSGKRFKLLSERKGVNTASHIHGAYTNAAGFSSFHVDNSQKFFGDDRQNLRFRFPSAVPLKGATGEFAPLITLDDCRFRYNNDSSSSSSSSSSSNNIIDDGSVVDTKSKSSCSSWLLHDMTLNVSAGSRIGLLGKNGSGKSTLVKLLSGDLSPDPKQGALWRRPGLKIAHISQHHIEHLGAHLRESPVEYFRNQHGNIHGTASAAVDATTSTATTAATSSDDHSIRQFLGGFGLVGNLALQPIGSLSGGQKARLAFATVMYHPPHVLVLDEPTNHLDGESLESLTKAVASFGGAVVSVSHHKGFLSQTCHEVWTIRNDGTVGVQAVESSSDTTYTSDQNHHHHHNNKNSKSSTGGDGITFDALYENYKDNLRREVRLGQKKERQRRQNE